MCANKHHQQRPPDVSEKPTPRTSGNENAGAIVLRSIMVEGVNDMGSFKTIANRQRRVGVAPVLPQSPTLPADPRRSCCRPPVLAGCVRIFVAQKRSVGANRGFNAMLRFVSIVSPARPTNDFAKPRSWRTVVA
jgi:hypothetical protein